MKLIKLKDKYYIGKIVCNNLHLIDGNLSVNVFNAKSVKSTIFRGCTNCSIIYNYDNCKDNVNSQSLCNVFNIGDEQNWHFRLIHRYKMNGLSLFEVSRLKNN